MNSIQSQALVSNRPQPGVDNLSSASRRTTVNLKMNSEVALLTAVIGVRVDNAFRMGQLCLPEVAGGSL
jgi:hypothetical protein